MTKVQGVELLSSHPDGRKNYFLKCCANPNALNISKIFDILYLTVKCMLSTILLKNQTVHKMFCLISEATDLQD